MAHCDARRRPLQSKLDVIVLVALTTHFFALDNKGLAFAKVAKFLLIFDIRFISPLDILSFCLLV